MCRARGRRHPVEARPSYGYRRITALLSRQAEAEGLARVKHKRVYRVMRRAGLLLAPHTGRGHQRPHDGEVATATSNRRWAADLSRPRPFSQKRVSCSLFRKGLS
jgi:putative transposase